MVVVELPNAIVIMYVLSSKRVKQNNLRISKRKNALRYIIINSRILFFCFSCLEFRPATLLQMD